MIFCSSELRGIISGSALATRVRISYSTLFRNSRVREMLNKFIVECSHSEKPESDFVVKMGNPEPHLLLFSELQWNLISFGSDGGMSFNGWSCRFVRPWFCRGLSLREKPDHGLFVFLGRQRP